MDIWTGWDYVHGTYEHTGFKKAHTVFEDFQSIPPVEWPATLVLGIQVTTSYLTMDRPEVEPLITTLSARLAQEPSQSHDFVQSYRYENPDDVKKAMTSPISSHSNTMWLDDRVVSHASEQTNWGLHRGIDYVFIDGFSEKQFERRSPEDLSDSIFYTMRLGSLPIKMGTQDINIKNSLFAEQLTKSISLVLFDLTSIFNRH